MAAFGVIYGRWLVRRRLRSWRLVRRRFVGRLAFRSSSTGLTIAMPITRAL
jgi:hypothetical protein